MYNSNFLTKLAFAVTAIALVSCKQDAHSGRANVKAETAPKTIIARVPVNPKTASEAKIELVTSDQEVSKTNAADIEKAFNSGKTMQIHSEGDLLGATDTVSGKSFSLYGCQSVYSPYGQYQPNPYGQNPYGQMPYGQYQQQQQQSGGIFGSLFQNLLGGMNIGSLFGGLMPQGGMFGNLLGAFQNVAPFMQNGMMPVGLPFGQNVNQQYCNNGYQNGGYQYGAPTNGYQQMPGTPYTPGYGTTPYPYSGQYQQGNYNYYTYGQQPVYGQPVYGQPVGGQQPVYGQPVYGQPVGGQQPVYGQPVGGQYPQYQPVGTTPQYGGTPYSYQPSGQYNYTPYPVGYSGGNTGLQ